ncbi:MAG: DUF4240 domain-containing protein [Micrococcales bacterium]|nr:DUF4240 domain-containing protein [Micrococcales bacterium]
MEIDAFWAVIDRARTPAHDMADSLVAELAQLTDEQVVRWDQIFDVYQELSYRSKLWAAANLIEDECSDDGFDYFRAWLICQGRDVFFAAVADPDSLAPVVEHTRDDCCEDGNLLSVARYAWTRKSPGRDEAAWFALDPDPLPDDLLMQITSQIRYADDIDTDWDDDDLDDLLPRLAAVVG